MLDQAVLTGTEKLAATSGFKTMLSQSVQIKELSGTAEASAGECNSSTLRLESCNTMGTLVDCLALLRQRGFNIGSYCGPKDDIQQLFTVSAATQKNNVNYIHVSSSNSNAAAAVQCGRVVVVSLDSFFVSWEERSTQDIHERLSTWMLLRPSQNKERQEEQCLLYARVAVSEVAEMIYDTIQLEEMVDIQHKPRRGVYAIVVIPKQRIIITMETTKITLVTTDKAMEGNLICVDGSEAKMPIQVVSRDNSSLPSGTVVTLTLMFQCAAATCVACHRSMPRKPSQTLCGRCGAWACSVICVRKHQLRCEITEVQDVLTSLDVFQEFSPYGRMLARQFGELFKPLQHFTRANEVSVDVPALVNKGVIKKDEELRYLVQHVVGGTKRREIKSIDVGSIMKRQKETESKK